MIEIRTSSFKETVEVGLNLGGLLGKGDVVCLTGNLGTGKTAFVGGVAKSLGIRGHITSPTFTIVNEYKAAIPLYHFDVYRIAEPDEMFEIGFEEYLYGNGIVIIEWANLIKEILPKEIVWIEFRKDISGGNDTRIISVQFIGARYQEYEKRMREVFGI